MFWVFFTLVSSVLSLASVGVPQQDARINPGFGMYLVAEHRTADSFAVTFQGREYQLQNESIISAEDIAHVELDYDQGIGNPVIQFEIKPDGAERLEAATADNVGDELCVIVETWVISCATIQGVFGERFQTTFVSAAEAHETYNQIIAGHEGGPASESNFLQKLGQ